MATQAETKTVDTKAAAAAEKAYAAAADAVSPKKADEAARPAAAKIDKAVAEVTAAPKKAKKAVRKAKPAAAKKAAAPKKIASKAKKAAKVATPKAAKAPAKPAPTTISKLKDRIMATTQTADFTKTVKETAAQAQTRAKAAYDKLQAYSGEVTEFTKGNVEALVESGKILGAGVQDLARDEVEAAKGAFETLTADLKALAGIKNPTDLFKLQGEIARRNFDMLVARTSKNAEVSMKLAGDAFAPISSRMSLVAEKISKAA